MARPLRIQYPGAYYHVMNRGNRRQDIFETDQDRHVFVDTLFDSCLNPIRTVEFKNADFAQKCEYLKKYRWSSFAGYCYLGKRIKHMDYGWFLGTYFGGDTAKGRRQFREYVYAAIEGEVENPFDDVVHKWREMQNLATCGIEKRNSRI